MVTLKREKPKTGFWREHWDEVLVGVVVAIVLCLIAWGALTIFSDIKADKARIAATKFEVNGVIERVREEHKIVEGKGLLGLSRKEDSVYIQVGGTEYIVNELLVKNGNLEKGQKVIVSGAEGQIDSISISK